MKILEQALLVSERQIVLQSCDMMGKKLKVRYETEISITCGYTKNSKFI